MKGSRALEDALWHATAPPAPASGQLSATINTDVLIIGGGYTGLSTALHLAKQNVSSVVLEAREVGFGGSGRNAGHCTPTFHKRHFDSVRQILGQPWAERLIARQCDSADLVFEIIRDYKIECEAAQNGYVQAAHAPQMMGKLEKKCADYRSVGRDCRMLTRDEVGNLTGSRRFFGGWFHPDGGHLNPLAYARGLARAALSEGVKLYTQSPVMALSKRNGFWYVATPKGAVSANKVVIATGAYTSSFWPGLQKTFSVLSVACLATQPLSAELRKAILPQNTTLVDSRGDPTVYKYDRDGRLVTSVFVGRRRGRDQTYTRRLMANKLRFLHPELPELHWPYYWYGDLDMQTRTFPRLFQLAPGVVASLGYSGRGVPTGTMMGTVLAEWALGRPAAELTLPLEPMRRTPLLIKAAIHCALPFYRFRDRQIAKRSGIEEPQF